MTNAQAETEFEVVWNGQRGHYLNPPDPNDAARAKTRVEIPLLTNGQTAQVTAQTCQRCTCEFFSRKITKYCSRACREYKAYDRRPNRLGQPRKNGRFSRAYREAVAKVA